MEKIRKNKFTITIGLLLIVALFASMLFIVLGDVDGNETIANELSSEAENALIGDHGVGEVEHLAQSGGNDAVLERWGLLGSTDHSVVWVSDSNQLKEALGTSSAAATTGANTIIVFSKNIDWEQSNIANDVGTQKFTGILDGNGYQLNINLTANTAGGNGKKQDNNNAYYMVTQNDLGSSGDNFSGTDGNGMRGMGLVVGVNAGTIANMTINYTASGNAMASVTQKDGEPVDGASLDSASSPDVPYGFGIVTGINIGTIDNVYVNQQSQFVGNTKASYGSSQLRNPALAYRNCSSVGGIAGANMGYGKINNCYMYVGDKIWAQADGAWEQGESAAYSAAFAGGIAGWIRGNNSQITYCYLDGNGDINSWAMRGANYTGVSINWSISLAGGVTTGKFQLYTKSQNLQKFDYINPQDMNANQVKGIISNWTGYRRDSYSSGHYMSNSSNYGTSARNRKGMPFDILKSADQGSDKQDLIVFTYNYKAETSNAALDLSHNKYDGDNDKAEVMTSNWIEIYSWTHSLARTESSVSVTFENGYLRVQAEADQFTASQDVDLDSITRATHSGGYQPTYDNSYMGNMIWGVDIYEIGASVPVESADNIVSVTIAPTAKVGSFVRYFNSSMTKGSYVIKFGATYSYTVNDNTTAVTRQYNGQNISDMTPSLKLTNSKGESVTPNSSYYDWGYTFGSTSVELNETIYPGTYSVQPRAIINGAPDPAYAYYDGNQRTLAVNNGDSSTVIVTKATLSLSYDETGWVKSASIPVTFTTNNSQWSTTIIDAYSYQGGTSSAITDLSLSGTNNFTIVETTTTPKNGRTIYGVVAYVKKADGSYVEVADTTKASVNNKTATIKIDNAAPVLSSEKYYIADQFGGATVDEIQAMLKQNPDSYTALDNAEVMSGKWYGKQIIAVVNVSDESRSGISADTVGVQEAAKGGVFGNMSEDNYATEVDSAGNAVIVMLVTGELSIKISVTDAQSNSASIDLNGGKTINIDTTPVSFNQIMGQTLSVTYSYRSAAGKAFSKLKIDFNAKFGASGLNVWYFVDNNTALADDVTDLPEGAEWIKYDFGSTSVTPDTKMSVLIPEGMEKAAVFIMFKSGVEDSEPIVMRVTTNAHKTFTVDLNGANIQFNAQYITVNKVSTGESYQLDKLVNGEYDGITVADLFSKTYDGTNALNPDIQFDFTVANDVQLKKGDHFTGTFYANDEEANFRTTWLQIVAEYSEVNAGSCYIRISMTTTSESPIDMSLQIAYGGETGTQQTFSAATRIDRINMAFDISQIFSEGTGIEMSNGSYTVNDGNVTFNWVYGNVFDGLIVRIVNDEDGGYMYFRFNSIGKKDEVYMNVGGNYSAYVEAFMIAGDNYQSDDFSSLVYNDITGAYEGNAGLNFFVSISGTIPINVQQREVRLTFALDGMTKYSFSIPYDIKEHVMTASYKDVDGNTQYAKIVWKNSEGAETTLTGIKDIGTYTAFAVMQDNNYAIKGQYQQVISITATYLDVLVPDKTVQYNDGSAITYIPDLPEDSPVDSKDIVFTIIYYQKLGNSLAVIKDSDGNYVKNVTDVGEYYVSVTFDPEMQPEGSELRKFARKEYTKDGGSGSEDNYIRLSVVPADTVISGAENQTSVYNKGLQMYDSRNAKVLSKSSTKEIGGSDSLTLQYWDDAAQAFVDFDASSNNGKYSDAGNYKYRLVYAGSANYNATSLELTLTIQPAKITGVVFGGTIEGETVLGVKNVYTGKEYSVEADITNSNIAGEDGIVIEYGRGLLYSKEVPKYTIVGRNEVNLRITCPNYETYEATAYVIITTAPYPEDALTFDASNPIGVLEVEYDGNVHRIGYTLNTGKYGTAIKAYESMIEESNAGTFVGTIQVVMTNYEGYTYYTELTIKPKKVTEVDTSSISEIQEQQGLTSDTDLTLISVTFEGVNGETVEAELIFKDAEGNIVIPDAYGCLPAGTYTVTYSGGDNYDLSGVKSGTLTLAQGDGNRPCDHVDKDGNGICDLCGKDLSTGGGDCEHSDENGDGICDHCGASMGSVTPPKDAPNVAMYVVVAICGVLIVASIAGVVVAAVVKSKKKKNNNRYNII